PPCCVNLAPDSAQTKIGETISDREQRRARSTSCGVFSCPPITEGNPATTVGARRGFEDPEERGRRYGTRTGEVVQRRQGLRIHHARGWRRRFRPLLRHPGERLHEPLRGHPAR